jgi:iron(II)-dependent oxidoreductase
MPIRQHLTERLAAARRVTDAIFAALDEDTLYVRPIAERHRLVFYLGHLEAFDWNLLRSRDPQAVSIDPGFDRLFAFGIDPPEGCLPDDPPQAWPAASATRRYVEAVRERIDRWLDTAPLGAAGPWCGGGGEVGAACLLNAAIEHRLMHAETLAYMLHELPPAALTRLAAAAATAEAPTRGHGRVGEHEAIEVPAGPVSIGLRRDDARTFGWDNEYPQRVVDVPGFAIDRRMVGNGQFLRFVAAGGYHDPAWWSAEDWSWLRSQRITEPQFWRRGADGWRLRTVAGEVPLPLDWPVYLTHAEASAYARWVGGTLPTEAQWLRAALGSTKSARALDGDDDGSDALGPGHGNFDFRRWDPEPVDAPSAVSDFGVEGQWGNGWEWTRTAFAPTPGFEPFAFYRGYSQDFFDGGHVVLKGGSPRTAACLMRTSFRNWFRPRYRHVWAGFRVVDATR